MTKTVLFQNNSVLALVHFSSIQFIDRNLSGATTAGLSGPGSDGNKKVLYIRQSSSITEASPSDCLVSSTGHSLDSLTLLQKCSRCILQPQLSH